MGERESTRVVQVNNTRDVLEMVKCGEGARSVGATALNEHSSRSHCIVTVFAEGHNASSGERLSVSASFPCSAVLMHRRLPKVMPSRVRVL